MKQLKFIKVILLIEGVEKKEITIDSLRNLHEVEVYDILEDMFPAYIRVNHCSDVIEGYNKEFLNGLYSVTIFKAK